MAAIGSWSSARALQPYEYLIEHNRDCTPVEIVRTPRSCRPQLRAVLLFLLVEWNGPLLTQRATKNPAAVASGYRVLMRFNEQ
jgi:hypothetical protein